MIKNKNTLIVFVAALVILVLGVSVIFQSAAIKDVKAANGDAKEQIDTLCGRIDSLNSALNNTSKDVEKYKSELEKNKSELAQNKNEVEKNKQEIKKYQEILNAWNNASPKVKGALETVSSAYSELLKNAHLYPEHMLDGVYDDMMNTVYAIIRSTTPDKLANDFANKLNSFDSERFDIIMKAMIDAVKVDGVLFPEDVKGYEDALAYYNSFANNPAVLNSFKENGFDRDIEKLYAMLDADEERDLAKVFVDTVNAVDLPLTLATSLKDAMLAWDTLQNALEVGDELDKDTLETRALLDSYIKHIEDLAENSTPHNCANCIRAKLCEFLSTLDDVTRTLVDEVVKEIEALLDIFNIEEANRCLEELVLDLSPCPHN